MAEAQGSNNTELPLPFAVSMVFNAEQTQALIHTDYSGSARVHRARLQFEGPGYY
jgi:hypothetical protein